MKFRKQLSVSVCVAFLRGVGWAPCGSMGAPGSTGVLRLLVKRPVWLWVVGASGKGGDQSRLEWEVVEALKHLASSGFHYLDP